LNGERDGNRKDGARDRRPDSFLDLGAEKVGTVNRLTGVEKFVSMTSAVFVACMIFPDPLPPAWTGAYLILYVLLTLTIDISLCALLLMLKNQGNWWGW
jgi:hypothetical protein